MTSIAEKMVRALLTATMVVYATTVVACKERLGESLHQSIYFENVKGILCAICRLVDSRNRSVAVLGDKHSYLSSYKSLSRDIAKDHGLTQFISVLLVINYQRSA